VFSERSVSQKKAWTGLNGRRRKAVKGKRKFCPGLDNACREKEKGKIQTDTFTLGVQTGTARVDKKGAENTKNSKRAMPERGKNDTRGKREKEKAPTRIGD